MKDFQIIRLIGKGSFGSIYKVKNLVDKKTYAVKKLQVSRHTRDDNKATLCEIHILYHSNCPFILGFKNCFYDLNDVYIVTNYCRKKDLLYKINDLKKNNSHFKESQIWNMFLQMCYGIYYLHANNVIHRDLKTANIFLDNTNEYIIQIGDFGVSKVLNNSDTTGTQIGTPLYLSPELLGKHKYGKKTDIWALGCILYELITLKTAFAARNMSALCRKIQLASYPKIINKHNYSKELLGLLDKMLVLDVNQRLSINQILELPEVIKNMNLAPKYDLSQVNENDIPEFKNPLTDISQIMNNSYNNIHKNRYRNNNKIPWSKLLEKYKDKELTVLDKSNVNIHGPDKYMKPNFKSKYDLLPQINHDVKDKGKDKDKLNEQRSSINNLQQKLSNIRRELQSNKNTRLPAIRENSSPLVPRSSIDNQQNNRYHYRYSNQSPNRNGYSENQSRYQRNRNQNNNWDNQNGNYVLTNNIYDTRNPIVGGYQNRRERMILKIGSRHDPTYSKFKF